MAEGMCARLLRLAATEAGLLGARNRGQRPDRGVGEKRPDHEAVRALPGPLDRAKTTVAAPCPDPLLHHPFDHQLLYLGNRTRRAQPLGQVLAQIMMGWQW